MVSRKIYKRLIGLFFALAALVLLCVNILLIYVITGPRSLSAITPYIESSLAPPGSTYHVKIESSVLIWDGWRHPIAIHAKNLDLMDTNNMVIAHFPEVGVSMYFFKLLTGHIELKSLEVLHPTALLMQGDDGSLSFGFSQADNAANNSLATAFALLTAEAGDNPVTHLRTLTVRHASLSIKKSHGGVFMKSPDASLEITRKNGKAKGTLMMPLQFDQQNGELDVDFTLDRNSKAIVAEVVYTDIPSAILQQLFPTQHWMESAQMPVTGWAHVSSDFDANISALDFMLEAGPGMFEYPEQLEAPIEVKRLRVEGSLTDKLSTLTVKKGVFNSKGVSVLFNGTIHKQGEDYGIDGYAKTANVPLDIVRFYWPLALSPHVRKWMTTHIGEGKVEKADITMHFKPGEYKLKDTPKNAISSTVEVKNITVKYMNRHPAVHDITGVIKFTGDTIEAKISQAKYLSGTVASSGTIRFPDTNAVDVRMFLDMDVMGPLRDVVEFLSLPDVDKARQLNLTFDAAGTAKGNVKLDFITFSDNDDKDKPPPQRHINYAVSAVLENAAQRNFLEDRDISGANIKIDLNNKGIKGEGRARVNQVPMDINFTSSFLHEHEITYTVKTDMPVARLPDFGLPALTCTKGTLGIKTTFASAGAEEKTDTAVDLTQASISLPDMNFSKQAGEPATLKFETERLSSGNTLVKSFLGKGNNWLASGKGEFDKASGELSTLTLDALRFGRNDLSSLDYAKKPGGLKLVAKGRAFDATPYLLKKGKDFNKSYDISLKTDRLILGEGRELSNADMTLDCSTTCHSVDMSAKLPDGTPFNYSINGNDLNASCNNVGELLRVLGVFDGIKGGKAILKGTYKEGRAEGALEIKDYTLKNAPVLGKIFTIASLTGILDTLSGNGIAFVRLSAPFVYEHNILILKDAKAHGPALGITADGVINMGASKIDLSGVLVPSYTMNSLIGNIPLIGSLLTGGKGKGLIAINYGVKGDTKDPSVSVNPLSVLTPGFLRNVFDIFDQPAPDIDKIEADQKKAEEEKKKEEESKSSQPQADKPADTGAKPAAPPATAAPSQPAPAATP